MATYLVTGGAGFVGSWLVHHLLDQSEQVVVLDDLSTGHRANLADVAERIRFVEGSAADLETVLRAAEGAEVIFHQAAIPSVPRSLEDPIGTHHANVTATLTVLEAARQLGTRRVVYAASSSAYGGSPAIPKVESQLPTPLSPYAAAKLAGEHYLAAYHQTFGVETVALRYFNVFGPRQDPDSPYSAVVVKFARQLLAGQTPTIHGDGTQTRDFTYIENVVQANMLAARSEAGPGNVYNVGCGVETSLLTLLELLADVIGCAVEPAFGPRREGDPLRSLADISAARRDLGYEPGYDLRQGLERLVDHLRTSAD